MATANHSILGYTRAGFRAWLKSLPNEPFCGDISPLAAYQTTLGLPVDDEADGYLTDVIDLLAPMNLDCSQLLPSEILAALDKL